MMLVIVVPAPPAAVVDTATRRHRRRISRRAEADVLDGGDDVEVEARRLSSSTSVRCSAAAGSRLRMSTIDWFPGIWRRRSSSPRSRRRGRTACSDGDMLHCRCRWFARELLYCCWAIYAFLGLWFVLLSGPNLVFWACRPAFVLQLD